MTVNILCTVYTWGGNKLDTSLCEMSGGRKGKAERSEEGWKAFQKEDKGLKQHAREKSKEG